MNQIMKYNEDNLFSSCRSLTNNESMLTSFIFLHAFSLFDKKKKKKKQSVIRNTFVYII